MIAIITGDIVNSQKARPEKWVIALESTLNQYAGKDNWEIYRGDSFQAEIPVNNLFNALIGIKTAIKSIPPIDVRMGIGVGEKDYTNKSLTKSNGQALVFSGKVFDALKKETLAIQTPWEDVNEQLNVILELTSFIMNDWNHNLSWLINQALTHQNLAQVELSEKLNKKQSQISRDLKRAGYEYILRTINYCQKTLSEKC